MYRSYGIVVDIVTLTTLTAQSNEIKVVESALSDLESTLKKHHKSHLRFMSRRYTQI